MQINKIPTGPLSVNTYVVIDEKTKKGFIVDPGGYHSKMANQLKNENIAIEYIILTHGHGDHIGGVPDFMRDFPEAKLVAASTEQEMLSDGRLNFSKELYGTDLTLKPERYVNDGEQLTVGELELKFLLTPGHSPGGMCILVDNCLFSGDTLFRQSIGRTDFPKSSFEELRKSIHEKLFVLPDDTKVFPGHMGETEIGFEKRNNPFV